MVKERYGLALIDQLWPLDPGLITRPIAGVNWTTDTAFVRLKHTDHVAIPFRSNDSSWRVHQIREEGSFR